MWMTVWKLSGLRMQMWLNFIAAFLKHLQMREEPITDADGLVLVDITATAADEDAVNNFHIMAIPH